MICRYCWLVLGLLLIDGVCTARVMLKEQELQYREELVDGKTFMYRSEVRYDAAGMARKELWKIDGKDVAERQYEEEILEAEKNERRAQRVQEAALRQAEFDSKVHSRTVLVKKLLHQMVRVIMQDVQTIERYGLDPYKVFSDVTITAQEYQQIVHTFLPQAYALVQALEPDFVQLQELYERFDALRDRFNIFMRATLDRAIEKCDDTKFLKELLALVS
jgi:hypothetical protein